MKLKELPQNQFELLRGLAIRISNNSLHTIIDVVDAIEADLRCLPVDDVICYWCGVANKTQSVLSQNPTSVTYNYK